jgi:hypothetical protein
MIDGLWVKIPTLWKKIPTLRKNNFLNCKKIPMLQKISVPIKACAYSNESVLSRSLYSNSTIHRIFGHKSKKNSVEKSKIFPSPSWAGVLLLPLQCMPG